MFPVLPIYFLSTVDFIQLKLVFTMKFHLRFQIHSVLTFCLYPTIKMKFSNSQLIDTVSYNNSKSMHSFGKNSKMNNYSVEKKFF